MPLLLCDLDDTLIDRAGTFVGWATTFVEITGLPAAAVLWFIEEDCDGFREREDLFAALKERFGVATSVDELVARFYREFPALVTCADGVRRALTRVRDQGWRIAIVTNGSPHQADKIHTAGLDRLVDAWCISSVDGYRKPQPQLLELAAERCGAPLAGAWLIGDAPHADIGAAHAAGVSSVWLRRGREWPGDDLDDAPTSAADTFAEAVDLVLAPYEG